ncbi:sulfotransferase domain-containing protein [Streptomyces sp. TRM43335]|uniref:Sulfotransferase domain-containing protein n=1 Tax=Streptomyces taklimakanensis TaxID=2569853 RepID=A0A6G2BED9_9ACTN|nr:sulfotransferase domain-containing protein [Streptomyces taklimakanensis]MTE20574.1 sulfotransferase domain-containing protein [Streptomyces taklimakanensis]
MRTQTVPQRTYRSFFTDSTYWDHYRPRPGDIVISTPPKVGTTWTQRITSVLVFQSTDLPAPLMEISPWLDCAFAPLDQALATLERQRHRRFIKTHLPMDALPIHPEVSYLVVGRDLRDAAVSAHNHAMGTSRAAEHLPPGPSGDDVHTPVHPPVSEDVREFWHGYFTRSAFPWESDGWPFNSPTRHLESWWRHRDAPNVLFLHYQEMLDDLDGQMRRVSAFLDIPVDEERWPELVAACTFSDMRAGQDRIFGEDTIGAAAASFRFFHRGHSGQWHGRVTEEDLALYRAALEPLPADLRAWLARDA